MGPRSNPIYGRVPTEGSDSVIHLDEGSTDPEKAQEPWYSRDALPRRLWHNHGPALLVHAAIFCIYTILVLSFLARMILTSDRKDLTETREALIYCTAFSAKQQTQNKLTRSSAPVQDSLPLHGRTFESLKYPSKPFAGNPSAEVDHAWKNLLRGE